MKIKRFSRRIIIIVSALVVLSASTAFYVSRDRDFEIVKNLDIFYTLFRELNLFYVDPINPEKIIDKGIDAMLESLDPYTEFIPESAMDDFRFQTTGEYGGIGALIRKSGDYAVIAEPYEGFPAEKAGIRAGDIILEIDGTSTKGKDISKVSELLKGTPGTEAKLLVFSGTNGKKSEKKVVRKKITIPNVPYSGIIGKNIGYIRLTGFTTNAGQEVKDAFTSLKSNGAKTLVLDLRGNPGGLLIEAVNVVSLFVPKGQEVVSTRGKLQQFDAVYRTVSDPVDTLIPIIVLTSRGSASAAEIVAGSIQDLDRGIILGQRTFGKGLVQATRPLSYNTQLKVTTAKYYIPSGRCIQALDYTHRNEDGSVGYVPDSLIHPFKTKVGRTVFDGGGIQPDVRADPETFSNIAISLVTKNQLFDYATLYMRQHDSIASPEKFRLSDNEYADFVEFLKDKDFDYQTESEEKLQELTAAAKRDRYYDQAKDQFDILKVKLAHDKNKDLQVFKEEIRELLSEEIISRYYYQKGRIEFALQSDTQLAKALDILHNPEQYRSILNGSYKSGEKATSHDAATE